MRSPCKEPASRSVDSAGYAARQGFQSEADAAFYARERFAGARRSRSEHELGRLLRAVGGLGPVMTVLDVACGAGRILRAFEEKTPGLEMVGVDISLKMVSEAAGALDGKAWLAVAEAERLPFSDGAFEAVTCIRLLHHVPSAQVRRRILAELARVSRRGVVITYFRRGSIQSLRRRIKSWRGRPVRSRQSISRRELEADANAAGLRVERSRGIAPFISEQWIVTLVPKPGC